MNRSSFDLHHDMKLALADLRREYSRASLDANDVASDPLQQFAQWMEQALAAQVPEPTAMSLSTLGADQRVASRVVLLKGCDASGLVFYTNYLSAKGSELAAHPQAAALFYWPELERQVRIEGLTEKVPAAQSDAYFAVRPRGSQIGAIASPQSAPVASRAVLEERYAQAEAAHPGSVPRPAAWGGYRLNPDRFEFWQGRQNRLHDRIAYHCTGGQWIIERLAP